MGGGKEKLILKSILSCESETRIMVIVLGMHRSGTSLMTHILSEAGFFVGEKKDLIQGNRWNENGFFERWDIYKTNEDILNICGGSWYMPPDEANILQVKMSSEIETILSIYKRYPKAVIKDPRFCLTLPLWKPFLGDGLRIIHMQLMQIRSILCVLWKSLRIG
jgi:hypothetical protein